MKNASLRILAVAGSLNKKSVTRAVVKHVATKLESDGCIVDLLDLNKEPLPLFNPDTSYRGKDYEKLKARVECADVYLLGTPDYHGSISSPMKNFLDHFWKEFTGKLFASVVASHEKGLTVTDQLRTVARQCYAWSLPYGISFMEGEDVVEGRIVNNSFKKRLEMFIRDTHVYGKILANQRQIDLHGTDPTFMAKLRP